MIVAPQPGTRIAVPQVAAGAKAPAGAEKLAFVLTGVDVKGEFEELAAKRQQLFAPFIGKRISVAQLFGLADKLQQIYVLAGYPLARVVILPQKLDKSARVKLEVIDGFVERIDGSQLPEQVQQRVAAVLAPLLNQRHLTQGELERRLLLAGDTPGLALTGTFAAGKAIGGSLLIVTGTYRPVSASVYVDNAMPQIFGGWQAVTSVSENSIGGTGEQFTFQAAGLPDRDYFTPYPTRRYVTGMGTMPIGIDGWKLDLFATQGVTTPRVDPTAASRSLFDQTYVKLSYPAIKRRDLEVTFAARFDVEDERVDSLVFIPAVPLSLDRIRPLRGNVEGVWRGRETGTVVNFGGTVSQGLNVLGARMAADAIASGLLLSRAGADAVFTKADGHLEVVQSLPNDFSISGIAFGQTSFDHPLLTAEQYDISGAKMLSGLPAGMLVGDSAWALRGELARSFPVPVQFPTGGVVATPYLFSAWGERILENPSILEVPSVHVTDVGAGVRVNMSRLAEQAPNGYGFVEYSHRQSGTDSILSGNGSYSVPGWRVFTGFLLSY